MTAAALRGYLTSDDVAKRLKVSRKNLFDWEKTGKIPKAKREPMSGYRIYTKADVEKLRKIINKSIK